MEARTMANPQGRPFTPLNADRTQRLSFPGESVTVVSGDPLARGVLGYRATVEIGGQRYKVYGEACGQQCACDARIEPVPTVPAEVMAAFGVCDRYAGRDGATWVPSDDEVAVMDRGRAVALEVFGEWDPATGLLESALRKAFYRRRRAQQLATIRLRDAILATGLVNPGVHLKVRQAGAGRYTVELPRHLAEVISGEFGFRCLVQAYGEPLAVAGVRDGRTWGTVTFTTQNPS